MTQAWLHSHCILLQFVYNDMHFNRSAEQRGYFMLSLYRASLFTILFVITIVSSATAADNLSTAASNTSENLFTAGSNTSIQASPKKNQSVELNKEYFIGYWTDTKNILTAPWRWDSLDWLEASLVVGTGIALYTQDEKIKTWFQDHKDSTKDHLVDVTKNLYTLSFPAVVGLGIYGYIAPDMKAKTTFLLSTESFIITGAFVQTLKHVTGRHRPYTGDPHDTWSGPTTKSEWLSFPSGDASTAFSIASVVASEYPNIVVVPLVYGISTLVALERVYTNAHWASDVFIGSAIGYYTGKAIVASHSGKDTKISISPLIDGHTEGVLATYRF